MHDNTRQKTGFDPTRQLSQIDEQMEQIANIIDLIEKSDNIITEKLQKILRDSPIVKQRDEDIEKKELVPLAARLLMLFTKLNEIYDSIEHKRGCIEL